MSSNGMSIDLWAASRFLTIDVEKERTKHEMKSAYIMCHMLREIIWHEQRRTMKNSTLKWYTASAQRHVSDAIFQYTYCDMFGSRW